MKFSSKFNVIEKNMNIKPRVGLFFSVCKPVLSSQGLGHSAEGSNESDKGGVQPKLNSWHGDSYALFLVLSPAGSGTSHTTSPCHTSFQPLLKWRY